MSKFTQSTKKHLVDIILDGRTRDKPLETRETSTTEIDATIMPAPVEIADRINTVLEATLDRETESIVNPADFRRAKTILMGEVEKTWAKLKTDPQSSLTDNEAMTLEAVIHVDGSRPSLLVENGLVDSNHPLAGQWKDLLEETNATMSSITAAVGRVEPEFPTARNFFGTAWLVNADAGLAMTNLHVVEYMWHVMSYRMKRTSKGFRIYGGAFIDFIAENGNAKQNRFKIVEAITEPQHNGPNFEKLDIALFRLESIDNNELSLPNPIPVSGDVSGALGNLASFCVVGIPAAPKYYSGTHEGINWTWINKTLFGNRFGVKRLAPGTTHMRLGSVPGDPRGWVFGHDPTTLNGSSGSPVIDWQAENPNGFGIHFAGVSLETNLAHAFAACTEELQSLGINI